MMAVAEQPYLLLRPPTLGDLPEIERVERACFPDPWPTTALLGEIGAAHRFQRVALDGKILVGFLLTAWQYLDLHVLKVATHPTHRGRGIAGRMMREAEDHARRHGGETVTLEVRTTNTEACQLYRNRGYVEIGRRQRYYPDGEAAIVMQLPL